MRMTHLRSLVLIASVFLSGSASAQPPAFSRTDLPTGLSLTEHVIAGDFNGDGNPDLLLAARSPSESYGIYVMLGRGDGTFEPPSPAPALSSGSSHGRNDRTYTITVRGGDRAGNQSSASIVIMVPHDRSPRSGHRSMTHRRGHRG